MPFVEVESWQQETRMDQQTSIINNQSSIINKSNIVVTVILSPKKLFHKRTENRNGISLKWRSFRNCMHYFWMKTFIVTPLANFPRIQYWWNEHFATSNSIMSGIISNAMHFQLDWTLTYLEPEAKSGLSLNKRDKSHKITIRIMTIKIYRNVLSYFYVEMQLPT